MKTALALLLLLAGCGPVLTKPQVSAVSAFGDTTRAYLELPGSVVRAYESVHTANSVFSIATVEGRDAQPSLARLKRTLETTDQMNTKARELDQAVQVLGQYADLLALLVSDAPLQDLDGDVADLGKALDAGIARRNALAPGRDLQPFGASVATAVRGLGGILIRRRQALYLQRFVREADPMVRRLTTDIAALMEELGSADALGSVSFAAEGARLEATYVTFFSLRPGPQDRGDVEAFAAWMRRARNGRDLANRVGAGTAQLAKAHAALVAALDRDASPRGHIAELRALAQEIQAAKALRSKVEAQ